MRRCMELADFAVGNALRGVPGCGNDRDPKLRQCFPLGLLPTRQTRPRANILDYFFERCFLIIGSELLSVLRLTAIY